MTDIRTVLFDLESGLLDTAPDLAYALNHLLLESGRAPLPYKVLRPMASHGARGLIGRGFDLTPQDDGYGSLRQRFLDVYAENLMRETRLFPGITELLDALRARGLRWGIVTNKPRFLTDPLVQQLGLHDAACVVSGDTTANSKPHPEPLLYACREAGSLPAQCLYVGDAARDIEAGRVAGMQTLVALFGYISEDDSPQTWGANGMINEPREVLQWLSARE